MDVYNFIAFHVSLYASALLRISILLMVVLPCFFYFNKWFSTFCRRKFSEYSGILLHRIIVYSGLIFILITVLQELGFNITALLGAAGVFGFAIGFASQTSISNIISGFFLLLERPFIIGDIIKSGDVIGTVESIDLLSIRVRTKDNKLIRLPNENVLKNHVTNITYFDKRRIECILSVAYTENIESIEQHIREALSHEKSFLSEPAPTIHLYKVGQQEYGTEIRIFFTIQIWVLKSIVSQAPSTLIRVLKNHCDKNGIVITITTC